MGKGEHLIVKRINDKKLEGYKYLYDNYYASLCSFSFRFLKHSIDTEDVVQDVLFKLWESNAVFNSINALSSYLYLSVKNASLNAIRNNSKCSEIDISENENIQNFKIEDKSVEQLLIEEEFYRQIAIAINKLSSERKRVILLSMEGLTNNEIAEKIGVSVNTVKTLKLKAYRVLRKKLDSSVIVFLFLHKVFK